MQRFIVIPIYDHTPDDEVTEILEVLDEFGLAQEPYVARALQLPAREDADYVSGDRVCGYCGSNNVRADGRCNFCGEPVKAAV